jgi:predicted aspartyl protease
MGEVQVRLNGQERTTVCIFGAAGSTPLLGAYTLEGVGFMADPVDQRLIPAQLYLAPHCYEGGSPGA